MYSQPHPEWKAEKPCSTVLQRQLQGIIWSKTACRVNNLNTVYFSTYFTRSMQEISNDMVPIRYLSLITNLNYLLNGDGINHVK